MPALSSGPCICSMLPALSCRLSRKRKRMASPLQTLANVTTCQERAATASAPHPAEVPCIGCPSSEGWDIQTCCHSVCWAWWPSLLRAHGQQGPPSSLLASHHWYTWLACQPHPETDTWSLLPHVSPDRLWQAATPLRHCSLNVGLKVARA